MDENSHVARIEKLLKDAYDGATHTEAKYAYKDALEIVRTTRPDGLIESDPGVSVPEKTPWGTYYVRGISCASEFGSFEAAARWALKDLWTFINEKDSLPD